jgi:hypothetical protein
MPAYESLISKAMLPPEPLLLHLCEASLLCDLHILDTRTGRLDRFIIVLMLEEFQRDMI